jgi:hypothetical protein
MLSLFISIYDSESETQFLDFRFCSDEYSHYGLLGYDVMDCEHVCGTNAV